MRGRCEMTGGMLAASVGGIAMDAGKGTDKVGDIGRI